MLSRNRIVSLATCILTVAFLTSCTPAVSSRKPVWAIEAIAELTTTECYYHNVAKLYHPADNITTYGYKKMWIEYAGTVNMGIDASKVSISGPDDNGHVIISIPQATVIGDPDIDENSIADNPLEETGLMTTITPEERAQMFSDAQENMKEAALNDSALLYQARERAKDILEQYVKNVGAQLGTTYTVEFIDVSQQD